MRRPARAGCSAPAWASRRSDPAYPALRDAFLAHYANGLAATTRLFDGIDALLAALDARAIPWGIVTNKATRFTGPVVAALGLAARTRVVVSGDTTAHAKPHPAPLLHAAAQLGIAARNASTSATTCATSRPAMRPAWRRSSRATAMSAPAAIRRRWPATGWIAAPGELLALAAGVDSVLSSGKGARRQARRNV